MGLRHSSGGDSMKSLTLIAILLVSSSALAKAPDPTVATVTDLRGKVGHQRNLGDAWSDTSLDESMFLLDLIRTGKRSTTEMRFIDRTLLALGEKTRMKITIGLFNIRKTAPKLQAAIKAAQLRLSSVSRKEHSLSASDEANTAEVVQITLTAGSLTLAVDSAARFYRIEGPNNQALFIAPGDRLRISVVNGQLVAEAIPQGFQFAADFLFDAWDEELFGPESGVRVPSVPGSGGNSPWANGPSGANPESEERSGETIPGNTNPLDEVGLEAAPSNEPTGIVVEVAPRQGGN